MLGSGERNPLKIVVIGLTAVSGNVMERHNLGNYIIMDAFFAGLRRHFPRARIVSSIQMSDEFYKRYGVKRLEHPRFYRYGVITCVHTVRDVFTVATKPDLHQQDTKSPFIETISDADLVVDLSGDLFGDNSRWNAYLEGAAELCVATMLDKPVVMLGTSTGPFKWWRRKIARKLLPRLDRILVREPASVSVLARNGVSLDNVRFVPCPSVLYTEGEMPGRNKTSDTGVIAKMRKSKKTVGLVVSGWSFARGPAERWPRRDSEFDFLVDVVAGVVDKMGLDIVLMTHQNTTDAEGDLQPGPDHRLCKRLYELSAQKCNVDRLHILQDTYTPEEMRAIIGECDMLISGRVHGAIQGMTQGVPTVMLDYGHPPKAHKVDGFMKMMGMQEYVIDPGKRLSRGELSTLCKCWKDRRSLKLQLNQMTQRRKKESELNFTVLRDLV